MVSTDGGKSQYTVEKSNYECQEFGKYLVHLRNGKNPVWLQGRQKHLPSEDEICQHSLGLLGHFTFFWLRCEIIGRCQSQTWSYCHDKRSGTLPTYATWCSNEGCALRRWTQSFRVWERRRIYGYKRKWVDRINEITWKCSPECFPFLSKIENSITTISSSNWEGQMSTWIRSMQSTWETRRRVWHLKSWMPHGARKQACESPLQTQILLYRNRVSKDLYFTRMFFSGEVNDGRKVQGSWKYIKITEFNKSWSILNWVYKKVRAL